MREIRIPKGNGTFRVVYSPDKKERPALMLALPRLMKAEREAARNMGVESHAHGFIHGRSPVTCALPHVGMAVTLSCDLASWFDSVTPRQIVHGLCGGGWDDIFAANLAESVCHLGAPRQGLPTSPAACNLAAVLFDWRLAESLASMRPFCPRWVYTRYADDISVSLSVDDETAVNDVWTFINNAVYTMGWRIATHKTRVQKASAGRRVIVGVSVGETDIAAPKSMRRRLRAAQHQNARSPQTRGLAEWCAMKLPRSARERLRIKKDAPPDVLLMAEKFGVEMASPFERAKFADYLDEVLGNWTAAEALRATLEWGKR